MTFENNMLFSNKAANVVDFTRNNDYSTVIQIVKYNYIFCHPTFSFLTFCKTVRS